MRHEAIGVHEGGRETSQTVGTSYIILAIAVGLFQLLYWSAYLWLNQPAASPAIEQIRDWEVARIEAPTINAARNAEFSPIAAPERIMAEGMPAYHAFRAEYSLESIPNADLGIGLAFSADNVHLFINGHVVHDPGRIEYPATYHARKRVIARVSSGLLRAGSNEILAITAQNRAPRMTVNPAIVGDYRSLMEATRLKRFLWNDYKYLTIVIAGLIAAIAAILIPQTQNRAAAVWLTVLCTSIALRAATDFYYGSYGGEFWRFVLIHFVAALRPFAIFMFIDHWSGGTWRNARRVVSAVFLVGVVAIVSAVSWDLERGVGLAGDATNIVMAVCTIAALARLGWWALQSSRDRVWEIAALVLVVSLSAWDTASLLIIDRDPGHLSLAAPAILVTLVAAILSRNLRLFESMGAFNNALNTELDNREEILRKTFSDLASAQKAHDLAEERQRILRDMHDGIGGQLTGLILQTRAGKATATEIHNGLEAALTDLRLVVESLDAANVSFATAMTSLRAQLHRQLDSADMALEWSFAQVPGFDPGPTQTLQISRIIQEATINAIRHSGGDRVSVATQPTEESCWVEICISDNGNGRAPDSRPGNGLRSMQTRASQLGGDVNYLSSPDGFFVTLRLPIQRRPVD